MCTLGFVSHVPALHCPAAQLNAPWLYKAALRQISKSAATSSDRMSGASFKTFKEETYPHKQFARAALWRSPGATLAISAEMSASH